MDQRLINECKYLILPGKPSPEKTMPDLYNQAYLYWKSFWTDILKENGSSEQIQRDDFTRQTFITLILHDHEIVGMHMYTLFDLRLLSQREHSYFAHFYPPSFFDYLHKRAIHSIMTMEFFSVSNNWRSSKAGVSLGAVLVGLGLKIGQNQRVQAVISAARTDAPAGKVAAEQGSISIVKDVEIYKTPCDLIAWFPENLRSPKDQNAVNLIELYWNQREDPFQLTADQDMPLRLPTVA